MCGGLFKLLVAAREEGKVPAPDPAFDQEQVSYRTFQGFRSGSAWIRINIELLDPDPHSICRSGFGPRRAKITHKCWMFSFEG
jgi:hypothetical protein